MSDTSAKPVPTIRYRALENDIMRAEYARTVWDVSIRHNVPVEEVLKPEYWAFVVKSMTSMRPRDRINAIWDDGSKELELSVRDVGQAHVKVFLLNRYDFEEEKTQQQSQQFVVEWGGPHHKFAVRRISDKEIVHSGFKEKSDAFHWLVEHEKSMAA